MRSAEVLEMAIRDCESIAAQWDSVHKREMSKWTVYGAEVYLAKAGLAEAAANSARACAARIKERLKFTDQYDKGT